ncbi:MAG: ABC transporter substrate-binding protein [Acetobacteraceae bacterium]
MKRLLLAAWLLAGPAGPVLAQVPPRPLAPAPGAPLQTSPSNNPTSPLPTGPAASVPTPGAPPLATVSVSDPPPKVLRVAPSADLTQLDPVFASIVITRIYALMVYETLFAWDSKLQPQPQMVRSWTTAPDGLSWRFTLRSGLKFHDGQRVTTADVIPSLKRWMERDLVGQKLAAAVTGMAAIDPDTFEIKLSRPYPAMLFSLGSAIGQVPVIMRAADLAGDPSKPITTAIGSGPFRFNHNLRVSGAITVFDRNADYVPRDEPADGLAGGRRVNVERVEWWVVPDPSTASAALQSGELDLWEQPSLELLPVLKRNTGIRVQKLTDLSNQIMLRPNSLYPPFNNPKARLALAYIVNPANVMAAGFGDRENWQECRSYFICGGPNGTVAGTEGLKPDLARAKALLAEAGYRGEKLVFPSTHDIAWIGLMSEVVADEMRKAGMSVDIAWADWGTTSGRQSNRSPPDKGGWNLFATGASGPTMQSPLTNIGTNMACNGRNFPGWPCDEEVERLRQAVLDASDATRPAAMDALHRRLAEVQPYIVLGQYQQPVAMRSTVTGLLESPVIAYWNLQKR